MPNNKSKNCHYCKRDFSLFWRRHHCRNCYFVFCKNCTTKTNANQNKKLQKEISSIWGAQKDESSVRLCKNCEQQSVLLQREMIIQQDLNKRNQLREQNQKREHEKNDNQSEGLFSENRSLGSEENMIVLNKEQREYDLHQGSINDSNGEIAKQLSTVKTSDIQDSNIKI